VLLPLISNGQKQEIKPNILIIVSDDQGYGDFGFTGNKVVQTPTLDRLAKESAMYPYYMIGTACTPTRSSLLTGRNHLDIAHQKLLQITYTTLHLFQAGLKDVSM
jgi:arylsulfatase A-like enzyme